MSKKATIIMGVMLAVILCMQVVLISKIDKVHKDMISSDNFASQRIDVITSHIHELRNMLGNTIE